STPRATRDSRPQRGEAWVGPQGVEVCALQVEGVDLSAGLEHLQLLEGGVRVAQLRVHPRQVELGERRVLFLPSVARLRLRRLGEQRQRLFRLALQVE